MSLSEFELRLTRYEHAVQAEHEQRQRVARARQDLIDCVQEHVEASVKVALAAATISATPQMHADKYVVDDGWFSETCACSVCERRRAQRDLYQIRETGNNLKPAEETPTPVPLDTSGGN